MGFLNWLSRRPRPLVSGVLHVPPGGVLVLIVRPGMCANALHQMRQAAAEIAGKSQVQILVLCGEGVQARATGARE